MAGARDPPPQSPTFFPHFAAIPTRWMDNDVYGHVNNVVYYAYFDTVINRYLIDEGGLDIARGATIGLCVESRCTYRKAVAFPDDVDAGLRVAKLGRRPRARSFTSSSTAQRARPFPSPTRSARPSAGSSARREARSHHRDH